MGKSKEEDCIPFAKDNYLKLKYSHQTMPLSNYGAEGQLQTPSNLIVKQKELYHTCRIAKTRVKSRVQVYRVEGKSLFYQC